MRPVLVLPLLLGACKPPPDAPAELDQLVAYLFEHHDDEDPEPLQVGAANLDRWLDARLEETLEGYSVADVSRSALDEIGVGEVDFERLAGAAVGHESAWAPDALGAAITAAPALEMYPDDYTAYERTYHGDVDCFLDGDCVFLEATVRSSASYALGLDVTSTSRVQYRWFETDAGRAFAQRSWLVEPVTVSVEWLDVEEQFFLWVILPEGEGARSIQATWVVATITGADVPEGLALNLVIDQMQTFATSVDAWVAAGG